MQLSHCWKAQGSGLLLSQGSPEARLFPGSSVQGAQGVPLGCLKGLLAGACLPGQLLRRFQEMHPMKYGASDALGLHCGFSYILCVHFADLTDYSIAKNLSRSPPCMLLTSKPLPPIRKSSPSTKLNMMCSGEEKGRNGTGYNDISNKKELSSERKGSKVRRPR